MLPPFILLMDISYTSISPVNFVYVCDASRGVARKSVKCLEGGLKQ